MVGMASLHETAKNAPHLPGVYTFRSSEGTPQYIGKAKDLHSRLSSYFSSDAPDKTRLMISKSHSLEWVVTDNEAEALLLENGMIKRHYPKYNIDLKDSEKFTYILITDEEFPRMVLVRKGRGGKIPSGGKAYGPFTAGSAYSLVASTLRKIFKIRTCKVNQGKPCLQYHLGFCTGVCAGLISRREYLRQVEKLKMALSGGKKLEELIDSMESEMKKASSEKRFERAIELRNSIRSLSSLLERQKFESAGEGNEDFICLAEHEGRAYVQLFRQIGGVIRDRRKYDFEPAFGDGPLAQFLPRFYEAGGIPRRIYVSSEPSSKLALEKYLSAMRKGPVSIIVPEKGDKKKLLELLRKNILLEIGGHADPAIVRLQHELSLPALPRVIECFDVSNLFGSSNVGSMVQFVNGKPNKSGYRRFKTRSVEGQDDFASMREIVFRRYYGLKSRGEALPDLIVVDGGAGQLNSALSALSELQLSIPCVSLAKEFEEIYSPDAAEPIRLPRSSPALKVLQHARDEAHRFVISYHRLLRKKKMAE